jgi:hypothetical protein
VPSSIPPAVLAHTVPSSIPTAVQVHTVPSSIPPAVLAHTMTSSIPLAILAHTVPSSIPPAVLAHTVPSNIPVTGSKGTTGQSYIRRCLYGKAKPSSVPRQGPEALACGSDPGVWLAQTGLCPASGAQSRSGAGLNTD